MAIFSRKQPEIPRRRHAESTSMSEQAREDRLSQQYAFKRNRTLTGSASSQVVSTNESNAQLKSGRVQVHVLAHQRRRIGSILLMVVAGALLLLGLVWQFTAQAVVRTSDVTQEIDASYSQAIDEYLSRQPIERLRFLMDQESLTSYVQAITPEVQSIEQKGTVGFGKSLFVVTMRQPIAGWSIRSVQQYVDATGTSFLRNYYPRPTVQIVDNSGIQVASGQAVASNQFLGFVGRVVGFSNAQQHTVTTVVIPQSTTRQIEITLEGVEYPVRMSIDRSAGEQVEDMTRSIRWFRANNQSPEYLDVRVGGRAFYR